MSHFPLILAAIDRLTWTIGFYGVIAVAFLLPVLWQAWKQRSFLLLFVALFFGGAMWFTGPYATDPQRTWACAALMAGGLAALVFFWRRQRQRGVWIFLGSLLILPVLFLNSPNINHLFFERFVGRMFTFLLASAFAAVVTFYVLPRLTRKWNAWTAPLLSCLGAFGMAAAALSWWFTAVEMNAYPKNPVIRTFKELEAEYERTKTWPTTRGIFLIGRAAHSRKDVSGENPPGNFHSDLIAWYEYHAGPGISSRKLSHWYPLAFPIVLEDGRSVDVRGLDSRLQTFNWKESQRYVWTRALHDGDPVIIWGRPHRTQNAATGEEGFDIRVVPERIVAQGSLDEFLRGFIVPGQVTARIYGWVGLGALLFSLLIVPLPGFFRWRWLKKHGGDDPPPPGYKGIKLQ